MREIIVKNSSGMNSETMELGAELKTFSFMWNSTDNRWYCNILEGPQGIAVIKSRPIFSNQWGKLVPIGILSKTEDLVFHWIEN